MSCHFKFQDKNLDFTIECICTQYSWSIATIGNQSRNYFYSNTRIFKKYEIVYFKNSDDRKRKWPIILYSKCIFNSNHISLEILSNWKMGMVFIIFLLIPTQNDINIEKKYYAYVGKFHERGKNVWKTFVALHSIIDWIFRLLLIVMPSTFIGNNWN